MKFIVTEDAWEMFSTMQYRGVVGFFYKDTVGGVLTFIVVAIIAVFAIIGVLSVLRWISSGRKSKEDPGKKWLRTGKF